MSFFSGWFKKKEEAVSTQDAIQKLSSTMELLEKKQQFLEKKIEDEITLAKKHGTKNKRAALQALARKKRYEKQLQQIDGTLTTIEYQKDALENATTNTEVLKVMQSASNAMKSAQGEMDVDTVHDILDDIQEQQQVSQEIADAISSPVGGSEYDQDDLMAELEALEEEDISERVLAVDDDTGNIELPTAPTGELHKPEKKKEDEELADLMSWAQ